MGRHKKNYDMDPSKFGTFMSHQSVPLRERIKAVAKEKGISEQLLVELYLKKCLKEREENAGKLLV